VLAVAGALVAVPAQAAVVPDGQGFIDTKTCEDAGEIPYTVSVDWNYRYDDPAGVRRVSVNPLVVERNDADAGPAADAGVDLRYRVYSGQPDGSLVLIQDLSFDGLDLDFAADDQASFNPRNPRSRALVTRILVTVGTDGDGLGNCPVLTFRQPVGIGFNPLV
jgi:hypothetical protein